jgi:preprotein translocase subunit SecG
MQVWMTLTLALQLLSALVMIGLVLVQHGKGADMGASFGGGASGSLFGATGSANFLSRSTAACATVFFICTLALALMASAGAGRTPATGGQSILDRAPGSEPAPGQIPGAIPTAPAAAPAAPVQPAAQPAADGASAPAIPR